MDKDTKICGEQIHILPKPDDTQAQEKIKSTLLSTYFNNFNNRQILYNKL